MLVVVVVVVVAVVLAVEPVEVVVVAVVVLISNFAFSVWLSNFLFWWTNTMASWLSLDHE